MEAAAEKKRRISEKLVHELGPIVNAALADPLVVEVMLNPDGLLWMDKLGEGMSEIGSMDAGQAESLMATIATSLNTQVNRDNPILEGELPTDGSRFEGVLPPITEAPSFAIRKKASQVFTLEQYVQCGIMTQGQRDVIEEAVKTRRNVLVAGGTGTGKTTFANAVLDAIGKKTPRHRMLIVEDTRELQCPVRNKVAMRSTDFVDMRRLQRVCMRMRPDRIIVGEVRGAEAHNLVKSWNTGHPGGVGTVHADDAESALTRIGDLIEEGLQGAKANCRSIAEAINLIVLIEKTDEKPGRRIREILEVKGYEDNRYIFGKRLTHSS